MSPVLRISFVCALFLTACPADEIPAGGEDAAPGDDGSSSTDAGTDADVSAEATAESGDDAAPDTSAETSSDDDSGPSPDAVPPLPDSPPGDHFCDLPGSIRFEAAGSRVVVPNGTPEVAHLAFLKIPVGFCAHYFGTVGNARQLRFAPNGDLFVASPTRGTTGGGPGGSNAIFVLPDDNKDGLADRSIPFLTGIMSTQGILFANDHFYYQDDFHIYRVPYKAGDRSPETPREQVADTSAYNTSPLHWPKPMDQADDGTIYLGNGSDQDEVCDVTQRKFVGGILKIDGTPNGSQVAKGFRNPIAIRCSHGHNVCYAAELAKDYSASASGREKLVPIRSGDDWGFPCCATKGVPYGDLMVHPDCSAITADTVSFLIGDTPFSFDFERGKWDAPYTGAALVPLHGAAGSWYGTRIVAIAVDPATGLLKAGSTVSGGSSVSSGAMTDFATGWDDGTRQHGRPAAIEFASDGRMFVGNDNTGDIFWIAPLGLLR